MSLMPVCLEFCAGSMTVCHVICVDSQSAGFTRMWQSIKAKDTERLAVTPGKEHTHGT